MRISDWSSDVCSSDLSCLFVRADRLQLRAYRQSARLCPHRHAQPRADVEGRGHGMGAAHPCHQHHRCRPPDVRRRRRRRQDGGRARASAKSIWDIAAHYTLAFKQNLADLNVRAPSRWSVATDHIADMIAFAGQIAPEHCYELDSGLYFDVSTVPDYGAPAGGQDDAAEIGRASCGGRGCQAVAVSVGGGSLKKKK